MFSIVLVPRAHERKEEGGLRFPSIETAELQNPHQDHIVLLTPTAAVRDVRGVMRLAVGASLLETSGNNEEPD